MKYEIELSEKLEEPLLKVIESLKSLNKDKEFSVERVLAEVCKQFIVSEYSKVLMAE